MYYLSPTKKNEMGGACGNMGENRGAHVAWVGKPEGRERDHFEYLSIDARVILEWIVKIYMGQREPE